jgi:hypothetical protein
MVYAVKDQQWPMVLFRRSNSETMSRRNIAIPAGEELVTPGSESATAFLLPTTRSTLAAK